MTFKLSFLENSMSNKGKGRRKTSFFNIFTGFLVVVIISYLLFIPKQKTITQRELSIGDIAREDIVVNNDITLEDKERTETAKKKAEENVVPIYEHFKTNQVKSRDLIKRWFELIRTSKKEYVKNKNELANIKEKIESEFGLEYSEKELRRILKIPFFSQVDLNSLLTVVLNLYEKGIVTSLVNPRKSNEDTIRIVSKKGETYIKKTYELYDLKIAKTELITFIKNQQVNEETAKFIASILMEFIDVNLSYSSNLTKEEQKRASASISPVLIKLKKGKVVLRKGDEVKPETKRTLDLIEHQDNIRQQRLPRIYLIMVILGLLALFGGKFFKIWQSGSMSKEKIFVVMGATLTVCALVYRMSIFLIPLILKNMTLEFDYNMHSIFFAIPFGFGVLVMAFVFNLQSAVIFSFVNSMIGGIICDWDFKIVIFILLGNLAVSFGIEYYQRLKRSPIIKASILWMLPVNVVTILIFNLTEPDVGVELISVNVMMVVISAVLTPILANFVIPLWEILFKLVTELKLIELTNLNLPIFREMLEKAPGTYHHSQMVASLAEAAALDMGLSPLMQTAMALYHDIGKIDNPHFFTENHTLYKNPHNNLSPRESAKNIVSHITDGLERAEKLKLPAVVSASISQHHGSKLVRFFYDKAREMSSVDSDGFEDKVFRYPGEKPKNIENAIIMLADQVEAASKSLASPSDEEIKNVIRKIINANIEENQFDDCEGLTFRALNIIANSFHKKLSSIYHMRISYPGFDFKEKKGEEEKTSIEGAK